VPTSNFPTQPDSPDVPVPSLVRLLIRLQVGDFSIYSKRSTGELRVVPRIKDSILDDIHDHFEEIQTLLPGTCDRCGVWSIKRIEAYWEDNPHFCVRCTAVATLHFSKTGEWPSANIPDDLCDAPE